MLNLCIQKCHIWVHAYSNFYPKSSFPSGQSCWAKQQRQLQLYFFRAQVDFSVDRINLSICIFKFVAPWLPSPHSLLYGYLIRHTGETRLVIFDKKQMNKVYQVYTEVNCEHLPDRERHLRSARAWREAALEMIYLPTCRRSASCTWILGLWCFFGPFFLEFQRKNFVISVLVNPGWHGTAYL